MTLSAPSWKDYQSFHLRLGEGYWFERIVQTPHGPLLIGKGTNTLFLENIGDSGREVVLTCREILESATARLDFFFSPTTSGNVELFKEYLSLGGYARETVVDWYALAPKQEARSSQIRRATPLDSAKIAEIEDVCFPDSPHDRDALIKLVEYPRTSVTDRVLILQDEKTGEDAGIIASAHHGCFGYVHDLGVLPAFRRRGYGRKLMQESLSLLNKEGVECVVSAAETGNTPSVDLHLKRGYVPFARTESWHIPTPSTTTERTSP